MENIKDKIRILHISDLHLMNNPLQQEIIENFFTAIGSPEEIQFDYIAITGDLFDGRYRKDDTKASAAYPDGWRLSYGRIFFKQLAAYVGGDPQRIFICYGNHDLNLFYQKNEDSFNYYTPGCKKHIENLMRQQNLMDALPPPRQGFWHCIKSKFTSKKNITPRLPQVNVERYKLAVLNTLNNTVIDKSNYSNTPVAQLEDALFEDMHTRYIANSTSRLNQPFSFYVHKCADGVVFVSINTSWLNIDSELMDGKLEVGKVVMDYIEKEIASCREESVYVITLMHNSFNHFAHSHIHSTREKSIFATITNFSDLILCGHEHGELPPSLVNFDAYVLRVGSAFKPDNDIVQAFSIINLNFQTMTLERDLYTYNKQFACVGKPVTGIPRTNRTPAGIFSRFELKPADASVQFVNPERTVEQFYQFCKKRKVQIVNGNKEFVRELSELFITTEYFSEYIAERQKWLSEKIKEGEI